MVSIKARLIIFFAGEDGEALYSQQKQDLLLTMAQIISSLLQKFRFKLKKVEKTTSPFRYDLNPLLLYSRGNELSQGIRSDRQGA